MNKEVIIVFIFIMILISIQYTLNKILMEIKKLNSLLPYLKYKGGDEREKEETQDSI